ncbi:HEAT repeat domain-containing protein [candidate division WOR-3 bacterium]|nr:HEAT repeat domain-containing protein [candidate division WOR-3 bacterium]
MNLYALLVSFFISQFWGLEDLAMGKQQQAECNTTGSVEVFKATTSPKDSVQEAKDKGYRSTEDIKKKMIEEDIRYYKPKIPGLIYSLQDTTYDPDNRSDCAFYLGCSRDEKVINPLISTLQDKYPQVRQGSITGLVIVCKYLKCEVRVNPYLIAALKDSTLRVQLAASKALIEMGDSITPIPTLISIFKKEAPVFAQPEEVWVKQEILRPNLPDSEQVKLAQEWKKKSPLYALDLLIYIGNARVISELENCLSSEDVWISSKVQEAIYKIKINTEVKNEQNK